MDSLSDGIVFDEWVDQALIDEFHVDVGHNSIKFPEKKPDEEYRLVSPDGAKLQLSLYGMEKYQTKKRFTIQIGDEPYIEKIPKGEISSGLVILSHELGYYSSDWGELCDGDMFIEWIKKYNEKAEHDVHYVKISEEELLKCLEIRYSQIKRNSRILLKMIKSEKYPQLLFTTDSRPVSIATTKKGTPVETLDLSTRTCLVLTPSPTRTPRCITPGDGGVLGKDYHYTTSDSWGYEGVEWRLSPKNMTSGEDDM